MKPEAMHLDFTGLPSLKLLQVALLVFTTISTVASAADAPMPDGMLGWWYISVPWTDPPGYAADPVEACRRIAENHMGRPLEDMRPDGVLRFGCKYRNMINVGGPAWYATTRLYCKPGYVPRLPGICVPTSEPPLPPSCEGGAPGYAKANPVIVSTGAKAQSEIDLPGTASGALQVKRTYRTQRQFWEGQSGGSTWSFSFDRVFLVTAGSNSARPTAVEGALGDGSYFKFIWNNGKGRYESALDKSATLEALGHTYDDWLLTQNGRLDRFQKMGAAPGKTEFRLISSQTLAGATEYYSYDPISLKLKTISDQHGRKLKIWWWPRGAVGSISGPDGSALYNYDLPWGDFMSLELMPRLSSVIYIDSVGAGETEDGTATGTSLGDKKYHYDDLGAPHLLTGITDENGKRYATYAYDGNGRAVLSEHAEGANRYIFAYPDNNTRVVTDPLGAQRTVGVHFIRGIGLSTGESQPGGSGCSPGASSIIHDSQGKIASLTDFNGNKTCFINDSARGLETRRVSGLSSSAVCPASANEPLTDNGNRQVSTTWHPDFALKTATAEPNLITSYIYNGQPDSKGQIVECAPGAELPNGKPLPVLCRKTEQATTDSNGKRGFLAESSGSARAWTYTYDSQGKLLTFASPADSRGQSETQSRTYYSDTTATHTAGDLATVTNAVSEVTQYLEYSVNGLPTKIRLPNALTVSLHYNPRQRIVGLIAENSTGMSERSDFEYDAVGNLVRATGPDGSSINYIYDSAHRLTDLSDNVGNTVHFDLDAIGNVVREEVHGPGGELALQMTRSFDVLNRLQREQSTLQDAGTTFKYDRNGNLTALIDQLGRTTTRQYDRFNRVVRELLPTPTLTSARHAVDFSYNQQDQLQRVTDPRLLNTSYTVDGFGQRIGISSPDTGSSSATFDDAGNLESVRDARGVVTAYAYDAARRPTRKGSSSYEYGAAGTSAAGQVTTMRYDSGQTTYAYDGFGRVLTRIQSVGSGTAERNFRLSYTYGTSGAGTGHITAITYPSGNRIGIGYGSDGRANSLTVTAQGSGAPIPLLDSITYRPFGDVAGWSWGNSTATSPNIYARGFDPEGRIVSYPLGHPGNNGVVRTVRHDAAGRITDSVHAGNAGASRLDQHYDYDDLDRLTGFDAAGNSQSFRYDKNGNRTNARFGATNYSNTTSSTSNRLSATTGPTSAKTNSYDAAGNLTTDGTTSYTYGASGRLESATSGGVTTRYRYNGLGQRVAKSTAAGSNYYVYDEHGWLIGEYDDGGSLIQETVYLDELPVAVLAGSPASTTPNVYYIYGDHLNTPRVITRASDNKMVWRWDQADPFGLYQPDDNPSGLGNFAYNLRFPGQFFDKETNNHYNYFRDYDPQTGRYIQSDPIGLEGGINTYAYVAGNPLSFIDPLGLQQGVPRVPVPPMPSPGPGLVPGAGAAAANDAAYAAGSRAAPALGPIALGIVLAGYHSSAGEGSDNVSGKADQNRQIYPPEKKAGFWSCKARADCNDNIPGNCPDDPYRRQAFGGGVARDLGTARNIAKSNATSNLQCQPKHVSCKCTGPTGTPYSGGC